MDRRGDSTHEALEERERVGAMTLRLAVAALGTGTGESREWSRGAGRWGGAAKLVRACGGCLGARRLKGVEGCDKPGGAVTRALIPGFPSQPGELKHLSTRRKRKKNRLRQ